MWSTASGWTCKWIFLSLLFGFEQINGRVSIREGKGWRNGKRGGGRESVCDSPDGSTFAGTKIIAESLAMEGASIRSTYIVKLEVAHEAQSATSCAPLFQSMRPFPRHFQQEGR